MTVDLGRETDVPVAALPVEARAAATAGVNGWTAHGLPEAGVGELTLLDGPLGLVSRTMDERDTATLLPSGTSLAASWDPDLVHRVGGLLGAEARAEGVDVVLGPNLNLPRTPFSGRSFEMFSEDPHLTSVLGAAWIRGLQEHGVGACAKHLVANDTETRRQAMDVAVDETELREVYLAPFEAAVGAGAWSVLTAYNRVRGEHCCENSALLRVLKEEWGFDGVTVSDWFATRDTVASARAGLDLEMPGGPRFFGPALAAAVRAGDVDDARLTDAAERVVRLAERVGRRAGFPAPHAPAPLSAAGRVELLRAAAAAGTVLLHDDGGLLPLRTGPGRTLAVLGPNAVVPCLQGGTFAKVTPATPPTTPAQALVAAFPGAEVLVAPGSAPTGLQPFAEVVLEGFAPGAETPGATETRPTSTFVWFGEIPGIGGPSVGGRVRLTTRFTASQDGRHELLVGGTGNAVLTVDGEPVATWAAPDPADVMGVVARADTVAVDVDLVAGRTITVVADVDLVPGRVQSVTLGHRPPAPPHLLDEAVELARRADDVVLVLGDDRNASRESADRTTTHLPEGQLALLRAVAAANPRTVVVLDAGHQVDTSWAGDVGAVLVPWYAGEEFGPALAEVLHGDREPGGRLPLTFARSDADYPGYGVGLDDDLVLDYRRIEPAGPAHFQAGGPVPAYPFGHGLGYTTWRLGAVRTAVDGDDVLVHAEVENTGERPGSDVVQVYGRAPGEDRTRLVGFARVQAPAGSTVEATIRLPRSAFRRWDTAAGTWTVPAGTHVLTVARSATDPNAVEREVER
ncbi:glycoside hydrolase family 3 protein [Kineococcus rhizosphaerae]|uniref:Beta-glucosidase n=1 Tax=Kineococcus rhizosphaerae TaxID=559628 RepID=A0A2T0R1F8_9ACTN|nr:glycoside hydrolase family 3 C-terminal domain-containing protein [Kineococcus rhizosphaerae]PRY13399.1 beta-glucosidase [Kineococcus rhizosphaerae]